MKKNTVTPEEVKANMQDVFCTTLKPFDKPVTFVEVRMKNGFTIRESTTCVDPANYDENIGKEICLKRIEDKVWLLLGYALQEKLFLNKSNNEVLASTCDMMISDDYKERFKAEFIQLCNRYEGLQRMLEKWDNGTLTFSPTCPRELYNEQTDSMKRYLDVLVTRAKMEGVEL